DRAKGKPLDIFQPKIDSGIQIREHCPSGTRIQQTDTIVNIRWKYRRSGITEYTRNHEGSRRKYLSYLWEGNPYLQKKMLTGERECIAILLNTLAEFNLQP